MGELLGLQPADPLDRRRQREDGGRDQHVTVVGSHRMPKDAVGGHRDLGNQGLQGQDQSIGGEPAPCLFSNDPVLRANAEPIAEGAHGRLLAQFVRAGGKGRGNPHAEAEAERCLDAFTRSAPGSSTAVEVMRTGFCGVQTDLKGEVRAWHDPQGLQAPAPEEPHPGGEPAEDPQAG